MFRGGAKNLGPEPGGSPRLADVLSVGVRAAGPSVLTLNLADFGIFIQQQDVWIDLLIPAL